MSVLLGKTGAQVVRNRRGIATVDKTGPVIWLHAASLGELKSVRPFLKYLRLNQPEHQLLVTVNNPLALELAAQWSELALVLQLAPLDTGIAVRRFLDHWQPVAFFNVEAEIWPRRFRILARRGIPAVAINARLSDKSAAGWKRMGLKSKVFDAVAMFFCQDQATADNLASLGIGRHRIEVTENLKSLVTDEVPPETLRPLAAVFDRPRTILAASTHKGEDAIILDSFTHLLKTSPEARLILAPRHPKRGDEIARLLDAKRLSYARRSAGQMPEKTTQVYLADTLGDMPLLYALSGVTLVAGSLVPKRGHTPYEPALYGSAIITGPHYENFAREYSALAAAGGCRIVQNADDLTGAFSALLNSATQTRQCAIATRALAVSLDVEALFARMAQTAGLGQGAL